MPIPSSPFCRPLISIMIALGLAGAARATEHAAPAPASEPRAAASAPAPASAPEMRDPLDVVRDRLAAKLSTLRGPDGSGSPSVLRVVSKAQPAGADAAASAPPIIPGPVAPSRKKHALAASPAEIPHPASPHWDYAGSGGPQSWGQLKPEFATCANGSRQSPIDISGGIKVNLDPVQFDYKPSAFRVIDNGHTVQVNVGPGSSIEVMGRRYELLQFHFHRPSEERIDGKQFDMVAHLVHKDSDGRLAVVAVLLDRGSAHALVQSVWNNLPLEKGDEVAAKGTLDPAALLPAERGYFTYMGSLTTPPCSEGVLWMVMKNPVPISPEQINIFARLYPMNARPIQSASGRLIKESN